MTLFQRIEALIERMATASWCDTALHAEAREIGALLREQEAMTWHPVKSKTPPINRGVLIRHKDAAGDVFDVAMYVGRQPDGEDRWIMSDIRLETRQITHWHEIPEYPNKKEKPA